MNETIESLQLARNLGTNSNRTNICLNEIDRLKKELEEWKIRQAEAISLVESLERQIMGYDSIANKIWKERALSAEHKVTQLEQIAIEHEKDWVYKHSLVVEELNKIKNSTTNVEHKLVEPIGATTARQEAAMEIIQLAKDENIFNTNSYFIGFIVKHFKLEMKDE